MTHLRRSKQSFFQKIQSFYIKKKFYLKKLLHYHKNNHILLNWNKRSNVAMNNFLVIPEVSSYLTLKLSTSKRIVQNILNYKCQRFHPSHFGKLFQISTNKMKDCNPPMTCQFPQATDFWDYFHFKML